MIGDLKGAPLRQIQVAAIRAEVTDSVRHSSLSWYQINNYLSATQ